MSTWRNIDGVRVGSFTDPPEPTLRRVAEALLLMKQQSPLHYSRILRHLDRIWVDVLADANASYWRKLNACKLDERFVLREDTTIEQIASAIVHEATHARLDRWGVAYDEAKRHRIETICMRRELDFVSELPASDALQDQLRLMLDYYRNNAEFFTDGNMRARYEDGALETLRHLGVPNWLVALFARVVKLRRRVDVARDGEGRYNGLS
jgi:hypothetical protein